MRLVFLAALLGCSSPAQPPAQKPQGSPFERFAEISPRVGEVATDFELVTVEGRKVRLSEATARGPVVLVWGSFT